MFALISLLVFLLKLIIFKQIYGTLVGQRGPKSNGNERVTLYYPKQKPHYWMQFSVLLRPSLFLFLVGFILLLSREYS